MDNYDLPLLIIHGFNVPPGCGADEREALVRGRLNDIKQRGFGGFVTNYCDRDYLCAEEGWEVLGLVAREAEALGLRMWLYDERGYPSGTAGGLTLQSSPELECRGAVMLHRFIEPTETYTFDFPHGHEYALAGFAYRCGAGIGQISAEDVYESYDVYGRQEGFTVKNDSPERLLVVYFVKKRLYEGTHAQHNVYESRRYIDVTNPEATAKFIALTHERYRHHLGDKFGGVIDAIFTDEPSFMGAYINDGLYPPSVHDEFDDAIPLYPVVNWGHNIEKEFAARHGYDILPKLIYLFAGDGEEAQRVRGDFYETMSELYENAYFRAIAQHCGESGLRFSGHILLEDDIRHHPVFEGNFFSLLRHMDYPGIDMLESVPQTVFSLAFTPKLVSSVARGYGKKHVMSEVSAHSQGGDVTPEQMICSVLLQYALGVDIFTSYYGMGFAPPELYRQYNAAVGRAAAQMRGEAVMSAALYYPIETIQRACVPDSELSRHGEMKKLSDACAASLSSCMFSLLNSQTDFDFVDLQLLENSCVRDGILYTPGGRHMCLVIPHCTVTPRLLAQITRLEAAGVGIIRAHGEQTASLVRSFCDFAVSLSPRAHGCVSLCRRCAHGNKILLVNSQPTRREYTANVRGVREDFCVYDPIANEQIAAQAKKTENGYETTISIPPYGAIILG